MLKKGNNKKVISHSPFISDSTQLSGTKTAYYRKS